MTDKNVKTDQGILQFLFKNEKFVIFMAKTTLYDSRLAGKLWFFSAILMIATVLPAYFGGISFALAVKIGAAYALLILFFLFARREILQSVIGYELKNRVHGILIQRIVIKSLENENYKKCAMKMFKPADRPIFEKLLEEESARRIK